MDDPGGWKTSFHLFFSRMVFMLMVMASLSLFHQNLTPSFALNPQGMALLRFRKKVESDPFGALSSWNRNDPDSFCSWFGIHCSASGQVVSLHLQDLCLRGTLAPELQMLTHLKSLILRNNSFIGNIPREIAELNALEVLDLGYNNFSGPFPSEYFANNLSLTTLLLDNNKLLDGISPEFDKLRMVSNIQADEIQCRTAAHDRKTVQDGAHRMLLQFRNTPLTSAPSQPPSSPSPAPSGSPFSAPSFPPSSSPSPSPSFSPAGSPSGGLPLPPTSASIAPSSSDPPATVFARPNEGPGSTATERSRNNGRRSRERHHRAPIVAGIVGGSLFLLFSAIGLTFFRSNKVVTVRPWATGLSGQLQRAFVTGVPKLKRLELQAACEDFSNIIGTFADGTVYKGTLSTGVEIAVTSVGVSSKKDWSKNLEAQFRKKIETLSKVNHKNFVNLIGFCEEDEPFTRMMVFEYAPNGTLFEHLHIKEAEHLDWGTRLRIAMGMAYCLEHMHQLTPPIYHESLRSSSIYLTEDYAGKISDFSFWNDVTAAKMMGTTEAIELLESPPADAESNVYSFGMVLLEMITGRIPYASADGSLIDWASNHLRADQPVGKMVDPTLKAFQHDELVKLVEVIRNCIEPDVKLRPTMREVAERLKEITCLDVDRATPRLSPLWWAELEIMSTDGS
ncbi:unnamed protein product [Linum trigynum]|uniref:Protein kinase domain-containing protein n=1 Tax=Linum trigynum TaxID=586398 RepID=A0AAV2D703_9ROSI